MLKRVCIVRLGQVRGLDGYLAALNRRPTFHCSTGPFAALLIAVFGLYPRLRFRQVYDLVLSALREGSFSNNL